MIDIPLPTAGEFISLLIGNAIGYFWRAFMHDDGRTANPHDEHKP